MSRWVDPETAADQLIGLGVIHQGVAGADFREAAGRDPRQRATGPVDRDEIVVGQFKQVQSTLTTALDDVLSKIDPSNEPVDDPGAEPEPGDGDGEAGSFPQAVATRARIMAR